MTPFEDDNCPPANAGSILAVITKTTTAWRSRLRYKEAIKIKERDLGTNSWKSIALQ